MLVTCDCPEAGSGVGSKRVNKPIVRVPEIYFGRVVGARRYRPSRDRKSFFRTIKTVNIERLCNLPRLLRYHEQSKPTLTKTDVGS